MKNGLYVVSTPIGNCQDITIHALEVLQNADCILCEDTRKTNHLLQKHNITRKGIIVYNEHSSIGDAERFVKMAQNHAVALVSDAGTPLICDPGHQIVNIAKKHGVDIFAITGACALIAGAVLCGVNIQNMIFLGFFHKKTKFDTNYTNAFYIPPHDIPAFLQTIKHTKHGVKLLLAREITKEFQEVLEFSSIEDAEIHFHSNPPKGEFVGFVNFSVPKIELQNTIQNILTELPNWQNIPTKHLAKFLHNNVLAEFSQSEIYQALLAYK